MVREMIPINRGETAIMTAVIAVVIAAVIAVADCLDAKSRDTWCKWLK
jgi:hypothetical protein